MIIDIDIDIYDVMSDVSEHNSCSKPSAIPSMVPFEISGIFPDAMPGSIPSTMLDVF